MHFSGRKFSSFFLFIMILINGLSKTEQNEEAIVVNKHNFDFIIKPDHDICDFKLTQHHNRDNNENVTSRQAPAASVIVYVHSAPDNFGKRQSLRATWSRRSMFPNVRIVFMMGLSKTDTDQHLIMLEAGLYGDIVQENFLDSYRNLTYKGIMAMKWLSLHCANVDFILKVDDDIVVNMFALVRHLNALKSNRIEKKQTLMCLVWTRMRVMRDKKSKWYLSKEEMNGIYSNKRGLLCKLILINLFLFIYLLN
jgi:hypothetical protein